ncbi:MAG: ClpXP protease specificity-enhancing factor [Hahellaceae bacterium]|nr:ClpXP protease specificity-enhancing factor [Hahellaceae bacterium]MCP5169841.1 ClpXP protease specificity-enhancing factor [Hahellaceae bacterium]
MKPSRPYLVRALNDWILDNGMTPYIVVDVGIQGVQVPHDFVTNGQIVLNVSPSAVRGLMIENEALEFNARFGGVPMQVYVPMPAIMAIYAKENGQGMVFGAEPGAPEPPNGPEPKSEQKSKAGSEKGKSDKPSLKLVK